MGLYVFTRKLRFLSTTSRNYEVGLYIKAACFAITDLQQVEIMKWVYTAVFASVALINLQLVEIMKWVYTVHFSNGVVVIYN